jgi:hypothetical protein
MDTIQQHYPEIHPTHLNMELPSFSELVANPKYEELLQFPVLN